jgi:hypothetical protein
MEELEIVIQEIKAFLSLCELLPFLKQILEHIYWYKQILFVKYTVTHK